MKKILSLFTVVCLLLSCSTTVFAGYSTEVEYVAEGMSKWELNVPIKMAPSETAEVKLEGTWDIFTTINVEADDTVSLNDSLYGDTKVLDIEFLGITQVGNNDSDISVIEEISVAEMPETLFGTWRGIFNYYLTIDFDGIDGVAVVNGVGYDTLQEAIDNATKNSTVVLMSNVDESVTISEDKEIYLDLNGYNITGEYLEGVDLNGLDNILTYAPISNLGILTIKGSGTIDATTDAVPAVYNSGYVLLEGGNYIRSNQFSSPSNSAGDIINSFYTVLNLGTMEISENASVSTTGYYQSAVANGIKYSESYLIPTTEGTLVIDGGTITGGRHAITNNGGLLSVKGGLIKSGNFEQAKDAIGLDEGGRLFIIGGEIISTTGIAITAEPNTNIIIKGGTIIGEINADETVIIEDNR